MTVPDAGDDLAELRDKVATASRILGTTGLAREITGHVSARLGDGRSMLLRCRIPDEAGLAVTGPSAIRVVDMETGEPDDPDAAQVPVEFPIHAAVLRARADVAAVVHVHPRFCVLCGLAGIDLRPVYGAYDHHATVMVEAGLPVHDDSRLVRDADEAADLVASLGNAPACLMRGHGITVVGATVEQATLRAVRLEHLAEMTWALRTNGFEPTLPPDELAAFVAARSRPVLASGERWAWQYYERLSRLPEALH